MKVRLLICLVLFASAFAQSSLFAQTQTQGTCTQPCQSSTPTCTQPCQSSTPSSGFLSTAFDISPYGGYLWPGGFLNSGILGVRGGGFVTHSFEIGANWQWNNHFQPSREDTSANFAGDLGFPQAHVRSNLWEVEFTYHFGRRSLFGGTSVRPYLVAGGGGLTTNTKSGDEFVLNNSFIDVPGVSPVTLHAAQLNGTLQAFVPGLNTSSGVFFAPSPTGSTAVVANDVIRDHVTYFSFSYGGGIKTQRVWGPMGFFGDVRGRTLPNFFGQSKNMFELTAGLNFAWGER
jgi:hypothetical protein